MIKTITISLWACCVALVASYGAAIWQAGGSAAREQPAPVAATGIQYLRTPTITVPMIQDGALKGYVVTRIAFVMDAAGLAKLGFDPQPFIQDEVFRRIYTEGKVQFDQIARYDLDALMPSIAEAVNKRLGLDLVSNVLLDELTYVDKDAAKPK